MALVLGVQKRHTQDSRALVTSTHSLCLAREWRRAHNGISVIAQILMSHLGWSDAWFPNAQTREDPDPLHRWWHNVIPPLGSCFVGVWTGPHGDMLCVRRCFTRKEARRWASPPGRTILHATLRALWLLVAGPSAASSQPRDKSRTVVRSSQAYAVRHRLASGGGSHPKNPRCRAGGGSLVANVARTDQRDRSHS